MKKGWIILVFWMITLSYVSFAKAHSVDTPRAIKLDTKELTWYTFEEGYAKAIKEGKILLVDAYTDWCGWCKVMDRKTYADAGIIAQLNESFVCVKLNPELNTTYQFREKAWQGSYLLQFLGNGQVSGFPTTIFWLNPGSGDNRMVQPGFYPPEEFSKLLDMVKAKK